MMEMLKHADDFGFSKNVSSLIHKLCMAKQLDGISLIVNMKMDEEEKEMIREIQSKQIPISIHLNILEGKAVSNTDEIEDLVDDEGFFKRSWMNYFFLNFFPGKREKIKKQLKKECITQINIGMMLLNNSHVYLDSHQHVHMTPLVFEALKEVIAENQIDVKYIRVSKEPLFPFLKEISLWHTYSPINLIKNLILNLCSKPVENYCHSQSLLPMCVWGLIMSGKMDYDRIKKLENNLDQYGKRKMKQVEMIFHPGLLLESEKTKDKNIDFSFYTSENRMIELNAITKL